MVPFASFEPVSKSYVVFSDTKQVGDSVLATAPGKFPRELVVKVSLSRTRLSITIVSRIFLCTRGDMNVPNFVFALRGVHSTPVDLESSYVVSFLPASAPPMIVVVSTTFTTSFGFSSVAIKSSLATSV